MGTRTMTIPETIYQVNIAWNQDGRRSGNEWLYRCPFHDDQHPSMSVNPEKGVYHCFGCGASGHISQIIGLDVKPQVRGVVASISRLINNESFDMKPDPREVVASISSTSSNKSQKDNNGGKGVVASISSTYSNKSHEDGAEMWDGVLTDLEGKNPDRSDKLVGCGKEWNTMLCQNCKTMVCFLGYCHDSLCLVCRRRLAYAFFGKHDELDNIRVKSLVSLQMKPELIESVDEGKDQLDRGRKAIAKAAKELGIIGYIYSPQPRIGNGLSAPVFTVLLPCDELKREQFLILVCSLPMRD